MNGSAATPTVKSESAPRLAITASCAALLVLAVIALAALVAPLLVPAASEAMDLLARRAPPSMAHWFGTDELGRDVLARVLVGARVSMAIGLLSAFLSVALGSAIGAVGGFVGGWVDAALMRITDAMLAVPRLPFLMIVAAILQPSIDRKSTRLNSSHIQKSRMPSSA